jgi:hydrogenase nickel incorporation protein HypA/HybF
MHEAALARSIVDLVREQAARDPFTVVRSVRISVGALSSVDPRALEFGFDAAARGTVVEGARLVVEKPPGLAWCTDCSTTIEIESHSQPCPRCGGFRRLVTQGDELRVLDLEVE